MGCDAMKLILKNFGSVIKSNIDSPIQTVGVDISREERYTKLHQFYFSIFTYLFFYFFYLLTDITSAWNATRIWSRFVP